MCHSKSSRNKERRYLERHKTNYFIGYKFQPQVFTLARCLISLLTFLGSLIKYKCNCHSFLATLQPGNDPLPIHEIQARPKTAPWPEWRHWHVDWHTQAPQHVHVIPRGPPKTGLSSRLQCQSTETLPSVGTEWLWSACKTTSFFPFFHSLIQTRPRGLTL